MKFQIFGKRNPSRVVDLDLTHRALLTNDPAHAHIHEGKHFVCMDIQNVSSTTMQWMVTTPDTTEWAHMEFPFICTGEFKVVLTRPANRTGTNLLTNINRNENSSITSEILIHRGVSGGSTDGTVVPLGLRMGTTGQGNKSLIGGNSRGENELMLKRNTKYIITVTTFANVWVTAVFDWYDHINE